MSTPDRRVRKRGVRASRARLNRALAQAGLKTQAALAERIADLEGLDAAPKDLVNRVFREQPVEPRSLERVARALEVEAYTLYLSNTDVQPPDDGGLTSSSVEVAEPRRRRLLSPWRIGIALAAVLLLSAAVWSLPVDTPLGCRAHEFMHPLKAEPGRLGIVIARFENDPANAAQYFLATSFLGDRRLAPYVSVMTTCRTLAFGSSGDIGLKRDALRDEGRDLLRQSGAAMLIWGRAEGDHFLVRFISTRQSQSPVTVKMGGQPLPVQESRLQIPLSLTTPARTLPDIKRITLALMRLNTPKQAQLRTRAVRGYHSSIDWLRAAVVSADNLRRSIDPKLNPRRWATVNTELCYNNRLLGDYDQDARDYRAAEKACKNVLAVRPKSLFPLDWAQAKINLASVFVRLHIFAHGKQASVGLLRQAEASLQAANAVVQRSLAPQTWAVVQRNLGVVYIRLGELSSGDKSEKWVNRGVKLTKASLGAQNAVFQPLDWAITQQNLCLGLHLLGSRRGKPTGPGLIRQAIGHCHEALRVLSPEQSPFNWAMAQNNLAVSEAVLSQMQGDKASLVAAIGAFKQAQTIYTKTSVPVNWAQIETNLGELYCHLGKFGDDRADFEHAVAYSERALEVFTTRKVTRYKQYVERQLAGAQACQAGDGAQCKCGG